MTPLPGVLVLLRAALEARYTEREQHAQLRLVQELLQQAENKMRSGSGNKDDLAAEITDLQATVLQLSRTMNLDDKDLAALAARSRESRNRERNVSATHFENAASNE